MTKLPAEFQKDPEERVFTTALGFLNMHRKIPKILRKLDRSCNFCSVMTVVDRAFLRRRVLVLLLNIAGIVILPDTHPGPLH